LTQLKNPSKGKAMSKNTTNPFANLASRMRSEQESVSVTQSEEAPKSSPAEMAKRRPAKATPAPRPNTVQLQKAEFSALVIAYAEKNLGKPSKRWTPDQVEEAAEYVLFLLSKRVDSRPTVAEPQVSKKVKDPILSLFANWISGYSEQELPQWRFEGGWHPWAVRKRSPHVGLSLSFIGEAMSDGWKPESHGLRVPMHPRNVTRQAQQPKRQKQPA
jgi:hypothetical protein